MTELASTWLALSQFQQGKSAKRQFDRQAGAERATAQRQSEIERRRGLLLRSRALAVAAASGGGADDPTVQKLLADIDTQGEYNALAALWEGNEAAAGLEAEGRARRRESRMRAASTILSMGEGSTGKYS